MATSWTIFIAAAIVCAVAYINSRPRIPNGLRAVPGPKGLPIIGSALQLPKYPEKQYMAWAREYGELFQVQLGWHNWIFVNSEEAVKVTPGGVTLTEGNSRQTGGKNVLSAPFPSCPGYSFRWPSYSIYAIFRTLATNSFNHSSTFYAKDVGNV
jgi:hypothetical protein